ncbi:hypothetical protein [Streptomyces sp. NPDC048496]
MEQFSMTVIQKRVLLCVLETVIQGGRASMEAIRGDGVIAVAGVL